MFDEFKKNPNPKIKVFLNRNKVDFEDERKVLIEEVKKFSKKHRINYFVEISAKAGFNDRNAFI